MKQLSSRASLTTVVTLLCACTEGTAPPPNVNDDGLRLLFRIPVMSTSFVVPAVDDTRVVIAPSAPNLWIVAYDRLNGAELWRSPRPAGTPRSLSIDQNRVLFAGEYAVALDVLTGAELWRVSLPVSASLCVTAAYDGSFYLGTDHELFALDARNGATRWRTALGADWEFRSIVRGVTVAGDTVFAAVERYLTVNGERSQAYIVALDRSTGDVLWTHIEGDGQQMSYAISEVAVTDAAIVFGDRGRNVVVALDRNSGEALWRFGGELGFFGPFSPPSLSGDTLFITSGDSYVRALRVGNGEVLWQIRGGSSMDSQALCGRFVLSSDSRVNVHERSSGRILQRNFGNESAPLSSRLVRYGRDVYVFGAQSGYGFRCGVE